MADSGPIEEMLACFRKIRNLRQKPAHSVSENVFDQSYFRDQRELMIEAYQAMNTLRMLLASHPAAASIDVSVLVNVGKIWTY
jgi:hypothetical protein